MIIIAIEKMEDGSIVVKKFKENSIKLDMETEFEMGPFKSLEDAVDDLDNVHKKITPQHIFENPNFGFGSKEEAELVLNRMKELLRSFSVIYVADLKDLVGFKETYVDARWGWDSLDDVIVKKEEDKDIFYLTLSDPKPIW